MNHSCGPTCVFVAGGEEYTGVMVERTSALPRRSPRSSATHGSALRYCYRYTGVMVATRDLFPGEEITYDSRTRLGQRSPQRTAHGPHDSSSPRYLPSSTTGTTTAPRRTAS